MKSFSLKKRFISSTFLIAILVMVSSTIWISHIYLKESETRGLERIKLHLYTLLSVSEFNGQHLAVPNILHNPDFNTPGSDLWAIIFNKQGEVIWQSLSFDQDPQALHYSQNLGEWELSSQPLGLDEDGEEKVFLTVSYALAWQHQNSINSYYYLVGENQHLSHENVHKFHLWLIAAFLFITSCLLLFQYYGLGYAFRPIHQLEKELSNLEQGKQAQLHGHYPKELQGVSQNLNALIEKENKQKQKYRTSMADLAHSLKNPIAIIRAEIHSLPKENTHTLMQALKRMNHSIEYQLRRAVISGHTLLSQGSEVKAVLDMVLNALKKVHKQKAVTLTLDCSPGLTFHGDENDLLELFGNLLDNAFKHARHEIKVTLQRHGQDLLIAIEDDGQGIPAHLAQRIFNRGERLDEQIDSQHLGHGIGLAVVADIVDSYEGTIEVSQSSLGGARFQLRFKQNRSGDTP